MRFFPKLLQTTLPPVLAILLLLPACHRKVSREEKDLRRNLNRTLAQRSYHEAELLARRVLQLAPNDNGIWDRLVQAECGQANFDGARETFSTWKQSVRHPSLKLDEYIGDVCLAQNDPPGALQAWHRLLGANPHHLRVLIKVARVEEQLRHWMEAETAWTAALREKESAELLVRRVLSRRHLHHWPEALADLQRAKELARDDPEVKQCAQLFDRLHKYLSEIRDLDAQLAVSPNDGVLLTDRSLLFLRAEDFELGLENAEAAEKVAPWTVRPKLFAGIALLRLGRIKEAERHGVRKSFRIEMLTPEFLQTIGRLDTEISVERTNAELHATRAWQLNEIGQPALALRDAESAAQLDPKSASAHAERSYALMKLGRAEESMEEIQRATTLDSNYATAWQYRGELEMEQQNYLAAIESLSRALSLNQTVVALEKREACYRMVGWTYKADEDRRVLEELNASQFK